MTPNEDRFSAKRYVLANSVEEIRSEIITDISTYLPDHILITGYHYDYIRALRPEHDNEKIEF